MKKLILGLCFATLLIAQDLTILGGKKGGEYDKSAHKYAEYLKQVDEVSSVMVKKGKGSTKNLKELAEGKADFVYAQVDAYALFKIKHPQKSSKIISIGRVFDKECLYGVSLIGSGITNDSDIQKKGIKINIGKLSAGSNATWKYMNMIEKDYSLATAVPSNSNLAYGKLSSKEIDLILFMSKPSEKSKLYRRIANSENYQFISFTDSALNNKFEGKQIYKFNDIPVKDGLFSSKKKETICTSANIYASSELDEDILESASGILMDYKKSISGEENGH